jgi:hypothetical protein
MGYAGKYWYGSSGESISQPDDEGKSSEICKNSVEFKKTLTETDVV